MANYNILFSPTGGTARVAAILSAAMDEYWADNGPAPRWR